MSGHAGPQEQELISKLTAKLLVDLALAMDRTDQLCAPYVVAQ